MRIGAYQFAVTGNIDKNRESIKKAISEAVSRKIDLLIFPECALTGYPPYDITNSSAVDFDKVINAIEELQGTVRQNCVSVILGTILKENTEIYNSAVCFVPDREPIIYSKRALWGYDKDNFTAGSRPGIIQIADRKIGIRICFEVRFPEYFRELYQQDTDLNVILFYDISEQENMERYELIRSHIRTRAVENVCHTLTVNTCKTYQTAPTALFDRSGRVMIEQTRNKESMLVYDLDFAPLGFGEQGRKEISDVLVNQRV